VKSQIDALLSALNTHVAGAGAHAASVISNTPFGNISSTTVQAALNELDAEKAGLGHIHAATDISYAGSGALADGSVIGAQSLESALDSLVTLLADNSPLARTARAASAPRPGYGAAAVSRGRLSSQVYELLQLINGKASLASANTWSQPQTMSGEPGVQYPSTTSWRQLLYIPGYTPLRIAFDGSSLWITINAYYSGGVWNPDVIGSTARRSVSTSTTSTSTTRRRRRAFASWARTWRWSLVGGKTRGDHQGYETATGRSRQNYYGRRPSISALA
jgi:hypothetical protein